MKQKIYIKNYIILSLTVLIYNIFLTSCCGEIIIGKQNINPLPLYSIEINIGSAHEIRELIDLSLFDEAGSYDPIFNPYIGSNIDAWFFNKGKLLGSFPGGSNVEVHFQLFEDKFSARDSYYSVCETPLFTDESKIIYEGIIENQYCISYIQRIRESIEVLCMPRNEYSSFIAFQKDRLVIVLNELSTIPQTTNKDIVIKYLADNLRK